MDLRVSAKDLIPNHLTMALYNHTEVRPCVVILYAGMVCAYACIFRGYCAVI